MGFLVVSFHYSILANSKISFLTGDNRHTAMFSGLFGPPPPKSPGDAALQQAGIGGGGAPGKKDKDPEGKDEGGGFDPTGLERAAKAAKVLNQSRFAKESLELIQEQEKTKQMEFGLQQTQYQAFQQKRRWTTSRRSTRRTPSTCGSRRRRRRSCRAPERHEFSHGTR